MENSALLSELQTKSNLAQETIDRLKAKIQELKANGSNSDDAATVERLKTENKSLKDQIEVLKNKIIQLDGPVKVTNTSAPSNGTASATNGTPSATNVATSAAAQTTEQTSEKKQKQAKQNVPKEKAAQPAAVSTEPVDISKCDIRVGRITECSKHPEADLLYVEKIDLGEGKLRNVCSGLVKYIPLEEMQNRLVLLLCNLKPAKLKGVMSEAMVLCASTPEKVELLLVPEGSKVGDRVICKAYNGTPAPEINTKNNIFTLVQPDLKTNDNLEATYKGELLVVESTGAVIKTSTLKNVPIK